jgi:hypothetical protein
MRALLSTPPSPLECSFLPDRNDEDDAVDYAQTMRGDVIDSVAAICAKAAAAAAANGKPSVTAAPAENGKAAPAPAEKKKKAPAEQHKELEATLR